jgi:cation:H+ antiporter
MVASRPNYPHPVLTALILLAAGAGLLVAGTEAFAEHIVPAARTVRVSAFGLAALVAGAEPEEAWTASVASWQERPDLAIGDALGANLVIATVTLGLLVIVAPVAVTSTVRRYAVVAGGAAVVAFFVVLGGTVARPEGLGLIALYLILIGLLWRIERRPPAIGELAEALEDDDGVDGDDAPGWRPPLWVAAGFVAMIAGGIVVVDGAERLVDVTGRSDSAIGLTVLALATSAEMLALVWSARRRGVPEVALAGTLGAIAYNATVSLGVAAVVRPLEVGDETAVLVVSGLVIAAMTALVTLRSVPRWSGGILVAAYVVTVAWLLR